MPEHTFTLRPDEDYIELMKLLKATDLAQSGGHAKAMIEEGGVQVNGVQEFRKRNKLRVGDQIEVNGERIEIMRSVELD